jgi:hypothetical protein
VELSRDSEAGNSNVVHVEIGLPILVCGDRVVRDQMIWWNWEGGREELYMMGGIVR